MSNTPETQVWLMGGVMVATIAEGGETCVTLTCTTTTPIDTVRAALATLATALQNAASERRELLPCRQ